MNSQTKPSSAGPIKKQSAPIDPEFRRLQLEIEIKKKEAEKKLKAAEERKRKEEERKQKAAEEKRKKEELAAQRKNPQSTGSIVSQNSKGAENKSSLSNIDDTETANKGGSRTLESLKPQSGGSFSGGSEGYLKEEVQVPKKEESMEARASRIKADILQANKGSRNNLDSKRDEEYDEDFEIKTPQKDAWELQKSIVEKAEKQRTEEVRRSVVQSKGLKEDVPSYNIAEPLQLGASKTGFRTQNLVGGDLNGNNNNNNNSRPVSASQNIEAGNSKGFQRRPLQTEEKAQNQGAGEYRGQKQNLEGNEINRLVREAGAIVDNNLKKVIQNGGREPIAEKTRQQLEIAMQAKKFMMEQQKAKKRNEEAAIEKKKQMLNQFYNKNTERRGPSISQAGEHVPEPAYYQDDNEDYSMTPQRSEQKKDRFEDEGSIRSSKIQGRNVPEPAYYHENDNEDYDVTPSKSEQRQDKFEASLRSSKMQGQNIPEPAYYHENDNEDYSMAPQRSEQKKDRFEDSIRGSKVQQRENIPDPAYYHENDNEDFSATPSRSELKQDKFETSLRGSKVQGQNIPDPAYYHENDNEDYNMRSSKAQERQQDKLEASLRNSKMQGQNIPEPAYYHENDNEYYSATPSRSEQRQDKLEASLRNSKMQGKNIPEPAYYHENDNEDYGTHPLRSEQKQKDTRLQGSRVPEPANYHQDDNEDYETYPSRSEQKQQYDSREPEDQDEHWEDGNEGEESDHRDPEEDEEEDQYQEEEDQEDDQEEEEEQSNNQWGYNKGNHRQYQDDASGLVELDRRDYNAQYNAPSQKKSEPREETRQSIAQSNKKSDWGYNPFEDDEPKSVMSTPYKQEVRQIPQSSAAQNDWSYDNGQYDRSNNQSVRQSSQSNNNWNAKNKSQPEDDYEKPEEEPKFSYAQLHARNKKNTQEGFSSNVNEGSYQNQRHYEQQQQQHVSYGDHGRRNNQAEPQYSKPAYEEETDKNLATFGRKHFANNDSEGEEEEEEGYESRYSQQGGQKKHVAYEREDSEDEREQNQQWEEPAKYEPNFSQKRSGTGYSSMTNQSVDRKGPISQDRYEPSRVSNTITTENENFNRIKENFNESNNKKSASVSMKPRGTSKWDMRRDVEGEDKSSEDRTPKQKGDEEYNTGNFGDKLPQIRSQWGGQEKSQSISTKSLKDLEPKTREETRIDDDEEEMLASYKNQANKEKKEEMGSGKSKKEVEIPAVVPKQQEKVLLVFDTEEDEVAKQRKQKKLLEMNKRMQDRKVQMEEKKERDRSFVGERGATPGPANVSDNEEVETPIRKPVKKVSERPVEKLPEINPVKPKIPRVPSANVKKAIFEREREPLEELHSVGPSAKSNKSPITKSPGGPNNIFQKERTPTGFGGKKGVAEFSTKSNKLLIKNAMGVCLAGEPNRKEREEVITKLNEVKDDVNFIIVFKPIPGRQDFKALYAYDTATEEIRKVHAIGNAPVLLDPSIVENYYRYNSGGKEFKVIQGNKNFSRAVDAVSLHPYLFKKVNADKLY